jgi:hypothetical protein
VRQAAEEPLDEADGADDVEPDEDEEEDEDDDEDAAAADFESDPFDDEEDFEEAGVLLDDEPRLSFR